MRGLLDDEREILRELVARPDVGRVGSPAEIATCERLVAQRRVKRSLVRVEGGIAPPWLQPVVAIRYEITALGKLALEVCRKPGFPSLG